MNLGKMINKKNWERVLKKLDAVLADKKAAQDKTEEALQDFWSTAADTDAKLDELDRRRSAAK